MFEKKGFFAFLAVVLFVSGVGFCQEAKVDWDSFSLSGVWDEFVGAVKSGESIAAERAGGTIVASLTHPRVEVAAVDVLNAGISNQADYEMLVEKLSSSAEWNDVIGPVMDVMDEARGEYWNNFLHYTAIGRFDIARGYGELLDESLPDPKKILALSESNLNGYRILLKIHSTNDELREISEKILATIEEGRYLRRKEARIIIQEINRLSSTIRGRIAAEQHLKNAGEYAIPYMLEAMSDPDRKSEFANITSALGKMGRGAIRPLVVSLQMEDVAVKGEIIKALGEIRYPQSLGYLKCVVEMEDSELLVQLATRAIERIDSSALNKSASELLFELGIKYYDHDESLAPTDEVKDRANIWLWDAAGQRLEAPHAVETKHFNELMAMRSCEWALKADENNGSAIALWLGSFFKAEGTGADQPDYFDEGHADAMTFATTAGPEYLHEALKRALDDNDAYVSLGLVEALASNAGEESLRYPIGTERPLARALSFKDDRMVRYSAAIAIGQAGPATEFVGSKLIIENLAEAIGDSGTEELGEELADIYALRSIAVMLQLALTRNEVVDVTVAMDALIKATSDSRSQMQVLSGQVLSRLSSPDAQRAIADMALLEDNGPEIRIAAFESLAISAKINQKQLTDDQVDAIYELISSDSTDPALRSAAASAYGALNLESRKVKYLILDQAKS